MNFTAVSSASIKNHTRDSAVTSGKARETQINGGTSGSDLCDGGSFSVSQNVRM